jgi:Phosphotransferase enzyme family
VFHAALADLPQRLVQPPAVFRDHAWAIADRIAWEELALPAGPGFEDRELTDLLDARRPVAAPSQLVHGDLTGNVLFADDMSPGIIDFSPYLRPTAYAVGVVVADAVAWDGADLELLDAVADRPGIGQCLVRALIFRHVTALLLPGRLPAGDAGARYARLRRAAIDMASG